MPVIETNRHFAKMDYRFMDRAVEQAELSMSEGGIPIGAVLVRDGEIVGKGHNQRVQENNPVAHAEIDCLCQAGRLGSYSGTTMYSTLMPCFLCAGAIVQFGIKRVVVGEAETFGGTERFLKDHGVTVSNLNIAKCKQLMQTLIHDRPDLWAEDIGQLPPDTMAREARA